MYDLCPLSFLWPGTFKNRSLFSHWLQRKILKITGDGLNNCLCKIRFMKDVDYLLNFHFTIKPITRLRKWSAYDSMYYRVDCYNTTWEDNDCDCNFLSFPLQKKKNLLHYKNFFNSHFQLEILCWKNWLKCIYLVQMVFNLTGSCISQVICLKKKLFYSCIFKAS